MLRRSLVCIVALFSMSSVTAQEKGRIQKVGSNSVETRISERGVIFHVYDESGLVVDAKSAAGNLKLTVEGTDKVYDFKLVGMKNGAVGAAINLSKVSGKSVQLEAKLSGIASSELEFKATGRVGRGLDDSMLISLQKTCPVSGKALGSMGKPPKVLVNGKLLFVCCAGCTTALTKNPQPYIEKYYAGKGKQVRADVFEATLADADAIAAQAKCPVMDEPLGGMGPPQKVNVNGKSVYICCAGCAKKLHAEPTKYLAMLAESGVTPPAFK